MPSFYEDQSFLNILYSIDIAIESHFTSMVLKNETDRIIYSSNEYALRRRAQQLNNLNENNLRLPFINYKLMNIEFAQQTWWNNRLFSRGIFIDEIGKNIRCSPVSLQYEATYWCNRADEVRYAFTQFRFDADSKTTIEATIEIAGKEIPFVGQLGYTDLRFEPKYTESDWLERNKIHSIALDFNVITFIMQSDYPANITEKVILEFNSLHGIENNITKEENIELLVNHFTDTIEEMK